MRLSPETLDRLPSWIERFEYDRRAQAFGIVHFGIGAFHRAHQAWHTDLAMSGGDRDWAICGVSLRSPNVARQLIPQECLYTITARDDGSERIRLIGAVGEVLYAPEDGQAVVKRIASPHCHIVSFTVTEKGYCRAPDGSLDFAAAEASFYPLLCQGLELRRSAGLPGVTLLSCDNLAANGATLNHLLCEWISARDPALARWFESQCTTPSSMVDRIVPRSAREELTALCAELGVKDEGAVFTETFSQWVIEDRFATGRPGWEAGGVQIVEDVAPYETAKLRMLNGAHSLLAYCGLEAGYTFVHEAVADPVIARLTWQLMVDEAAPTIDVASGQDLTLYAEQLLDRFSNPALHHRLAQIAMDGTEKLPQRWLDTVLWHCDHGGDFAAIRAGFEAWFRHFEEGEHVDDPQSARLHSAARSHDRHAFLEACFGSGDGSDGLWAGYAEAGRALARDFGP